MPTTDAQATGCFKCVRPEAIFVRIFSLIPKPFLEKTYRVRQKLSRNSSNVIYLVHCKKCNLQYVGSTTIELNIRFRNRKPTMKTNKKTCEVVLHFNRTPHNLSDFTFQCIDQIQTNTSQDTEKLLITKEAYCSGNLLFCTGIDTQRPSLKGPEFITCCLRTEFKDFVASIAFMTFRGPEWELVALRQLRNIYHSC